MESSYTTNAEEVSTSSSPRNSHTDHNYRTTIVSEQEPQPLENVCNETETGEATLIERTRHEYSCTGNELRQRNVAVVVNSKEQSGSAAAAATTATNITPTKTTEIPEIIDTYNGGDFYECNICFDTAIHPVLTLCGHLFCWSCLAQWLNAQSRNPTCPVCKAGCGKDKVIPIYGRGKEEKDPRNDPSIPTRPAGQRPPPIRDPNRPATSFFGQPFGNTGFNRGGMSISAGFGFFPLGVTFNIPTGSVGPNHTPQGAFMSRLLMMLLSLLIIAIIFA